MYQNRNKRKEFAKLLGLTKKKRHASKTEYLDIVSKAVQAGIKLHKSFEENTMNSINKQLSEIEERTIKGLMEPKIIKGEVVREGLSQSKAIKIIDENRKIEEKRQKKLSRIS